MLLDEIMFPVNMKSRSFVYVLFSAHKDNLIPGIQSDINLAVCLKLVFYIVYSSKLLCIVSTIQFA